MNMTDDKFHNLKPQPEAMFPKACKCCGKIYQSAEEFLLHTQALHSNRSSLKEGEDDDGRVLVEVFRNCVCGSTLMDEFQSRRDNSPEGQRRRANYKNPVS